MNSQFFRLRRTPLLACALLLTAACGAFAAAPSDDARVIFLVLDGARGRTFDAMLERGELPNLAALAARGTRVERAVGAFPSTTGPAYAPFVTGCLTGKTGVPGIRWYDRRRDVYRVYCGSDTGGFDADLNPAVKTIYELLPPADSLAVFGFIERGCRNKTTPFLSLAVPKLTGDYHAMDRALFDTFWAAYRAHGFPRFAFLSLHAPDSVGHASGPDDPAYDASLRFHDALVGELVARLKSEGLFSTVTFMITSDHGQQNASKGMDTKAELERVLGMKVHDSVPRVSQTFNIKQKLGVARFDAVFAVSGNAFVMIYVKDPGAPDMKPKPSYEELRAYPCPDGRRRDLAAALLDLPAVRAVFLKEGDGRVRCLGRAGESRITEEGANLRYDVLSGGDPLGYEALAVTGRAMNPTEWLAATAKAEYPDGVVQIASLFRAEGTGDLVFIAEPGHEPWNEGQKGVHGSLAEDQNVVPMLVSGPDVKIGTHPAGRTADFFPLICERLGLGIPEGIDGVTLPILREERDEPALEREVGVVAMAVARIEERALLAEMAAEKARHDKSLLRVLRPESDRYAELRARLANLWMLKQKVDAGSSRAAAALIAMPFYADGKTLDDLKTDLARLASAPKPTGLLGRLAAIFKGPGVRKQAEGLAAMIAARGRVASACQAELAKIPPGQLAKLLDADTAKLLAAAPPAAAPAAPVESDAGAPAEETAPLGPGGREAYDLYVAAYAKVQGLIAAGCQDPEELRPALDELARAKARVDSLKITNRR